MPKILQITIDGNTGSTGRIAEAIGRLAMAHGWESYIAHGRYARPSESAIIQIGSYSDVLWHGFQTRVFDRHGLGSKKATIELVKKIEDFKPDVIQLHNIHGYYINMEVLFNYLSKTAIPVVWTFHDCWSITGHCAHFEFADCNKWKTECSKCHQKKEYPASYFIDRSKKNFHLKKRLFNSVQNMVVITPSNWLRNIVMESFMKEIPILTIPNGIDTTIFKPQSNSIEIKSKYHIGNRYMVLGVASPWSQKKGLSDFIELNKLLKEDEVIVLVGLSSSQLKNLPANIIGLAKTENRQELIDIYSAADLFINPTWEDNFPTTNLEALACGTPIATYHTGGSIEAVSPDTGFIVEKGDIQALVEIIKKLKESVKQQYAEACRKRAVELYSKDDRFKEYLDLYENLIRNQADKIKNNETNISLN